MWVDLSTWDAGWCRKIRKDQASFLGQDLLPVGNSQLQSTTLCSMYSLVDGPGSLKAHNQGLFQVNHVNRQNLQVPWNVGAGSGEKGRAFGWRRSSFVLTVGSFCLKLIWRLDSPSQSILLCAQSCPTVTPWTVARQAPLSIGCSRQEYWSGLPFPSLGDLPDPGIKLTSPSPAGGFFILLSHLC